MSVRTNLLREQRGTRGGCIRRCGVASGELEIIDTVCLQPAKPKRMTGKRGERYLNILKRRVLRREHSGNPSFSRYGAANASNAGSLKQFNAETACLSAIINFE